MNRPDFRSLFTLKSNTVPLEYIGHQWHQMSFVLMICNLISPKCNIVLSRSNTNQWATRSPTLLICTYRASSQPILFLHVSPGIGRKRFWVLVPLLATYYPMTSKRLQKKFRHQGVSVHSTQIKGPLPMQKTFRAGKVKNRPIVRFFHINEHDIINEILWCADKTSECYL